MPRFIHLHYVCALSLSITARGSATTLSAVNLPIKTRVKTLVSSNATTDVGRTTYPEPITLPTDQPIHRLISPSINQAILRRDLPLVSVCASCSILASRTSPKREGSFHKVHHAPSYPRLWVRTSLRLCLYEHSNIHINRPFNDSTRATD